MGACSNRRGVHRYSIRAPLRWEGVESRDRGEGLTENISTRGVYFVGDRPMAVGQPIRLTMTLERRSVSVGGSGVGGRVEPRTTGYGAGVWLGGGVPLPHGPLALRGGGVRCRRP